MKAQIVFTILFLLFPGFIIHAQRPTSSCESPIEYANRNQVDSKRSTVRFVYGRVIAEVGRPTKEIGAVSACLGLFTEKEHRLVASVATDADGRFKFNYVPPGKYRLVVRDSQNAFCVANMPLHIVRWPDGGKKPMTIHMRPAEMDDCSYGDFK